MLVSDKSLDVMRRFVGDILRENENTRRAVVSLKSAGTPSVEIHKYLDGRLRKFQRGIVRNIFYVIGTVYAQAVHKSFDELDEHDMASVERIAYVTISRLYGIITNTQEKLYPDVSPQFVQDSILEDEENYYNSLIDMFNKQGIYDVIEVNGRKWNLQAYCRMCARTAVSRIKNQATMNSNKTDLFLVNTIGDGKVCPVCLPHEGKIYSKSGEDSRYPVIPSALLEYGSFHPNCRHFLIPLYDKGTEKEIAREAEQITAESKAEKDYFEKLKQQEHIGKLMFEYEEAKEMFPGEFPSKFSTFLKHYNAKDALGRKYERLIANYVRGERKDWRSFRKKS